MKIYPVGAELFLADGRTEDRERERDRHDEANSHFRNFANTTKKSLSFLIIIRRTKTQSVNKI